jgi:hypothetical protein
VTDDGENVQPVVNAARKYALGSLVCAFSSFVLRGACTEVRGAGKKAPHMAFSFHTLPMAVPLDPSPYQVRGCLTALANCCSVTFPYLSTEYASRMLH